jgi:hypothetical protein
MNHSGGYAGLAGMHRNPDKIKAVASASNITPRLIREPFTAVASKAPTNVSFSL